MADGILTARLRGDASDIRSAAKQGEASLKRVGNEAQKTKAKMAGASGSVARLSGSFKSIAGPVGAATAGIIGTAIAVDRVMEASVEFQNVSQNLAFSVDAAAEAVGNQTTKLELMKQANKLASAGVVSTSEEFANLAGAAAALADRTGGDLNSSLELMTKSLIKGNTKFLDSVGVTGDYTRQLDLLAKSMGKSTAELSQAEKQQLALKIITEEGSKAVEDYSETVDTWAHKWAAAKNQLKNFIAEIPGNLEREFDAANKKFENGFVASMEFLGYNTEQAHIQFERFGGFLKEAFSVWLDFATFRIDKLIKKVAKINFTTASKSITGVLDDLPDSALEATELQNRQERINEIQAEQRSKQEQFRTATFNKHQKDVADHHQKLIEQQKKFEEEKKKVRRGGGRRAAAVESTIGGASDIIDLEDGRAAEERALGRLMELTAARIDAEERAVTLSGEFSERRFAQMEAERQKLAELAEQQSELEIARLEAAGDLVAAEEARHAARLQRITEQTAAEERRFQHAQTVAAREAALDQERLKRQQEIVSVSTSVTKQQIDLFSKVGQAMARGNEEAEIIQRAAAATTMFIEGTIQTVKAVAAFASQNYPQGALHTSAAAFAFAQGALTASGADLSGGAGGASRGSGAGGGGVFGGGRETTDVPEIPVSPSPINTGGRGPRGGSANGATYNLNIGVLAGEDGARDLARMINEYEQDGAGAVGA